MGSKDINRCFDLAALIALRVAFLHRLCVNEREPKWKYECVTAYLHPHPLHPDSCRPYGCGKKILVGISFRVIQKAKVVFLFLSFDSPSVEIPILTMRCCKACPKKSSPTFPIKAVRFCRLLNMAKTLQGAPPGFDSYTTLSKSLECKALKSTNSSPKAITSYSR